MQSIKPTDLDPLVDISEYEKTWANMELLGEVVKGHIHEWSESNLLKW